MDTCAERTILRDLEPLPAGWRVEEPVLERAAAAERRDEAARRAIQAVAEQWQRVGVAALAQDGDLALKLGEAVRAAVVEALDGDGARRPQRLQCVHVDQFVHIADGDQLCIYMKITQNKML